MLSRAFGVLIFLMLAVPGSSFADQKIIFGRFNSRAIFNQSNATQCPAPLVVMIPGSGANGPEEMMPGAITHDGADHSIFGDFSEGLSRGQVGTLAVGKPGVDFFKSWDPKDKFYDRSMYANLGWQDLIDNLADAVNLAGTLPCVDKSRIYVLGHSEGTQVAVDYARQNPSHVKGLLLVGFLGENLATTIDWQLFRRAIDTFIEPDVDTNRDGYMSVDEAKAWPELSWPWEPAQDKVSFAAIEQTLRSNSALREEYQGLVNSKIWKGVFFRKPIYEEAASLNQDLYVFTGELDVQTRPEEVLKMKSQCVVMGKANCQVHVVPGLGHAMSQPKGPRKHKLLDSTFGGVDETFKHLLHTTALKL